MAASLSTTLLSDSLHHLNKTTNHCRLHAVYPTTLSPSQNLKKNLNNPLKLSPIRYHVTIPSATTSTGVESPMLSEDTTSSLDLVKAFDLKGNEIPISDLWKDRKAVVAFARHFGCVFCHKRADYLASKKDMMDASGVALILIGPGSIDQAKAFAEQANSKEVLCKTKLAVTLQADLKIIQLYLEGYQQDWKLSFEKDTVARGGWQQGGVIVAGPGKSNISYIHKDREAGDDPDSEDILKICCT